MSATNGYKHLEPRPQSGAKRLFVKGQKFPADMLYGQVVGEDSLTPEEVADNWSLPLEAVLEAIEYSEANLDLIRKERAEELERIREFERKHPPLTPSLVRKRKSITIHSEHSSYREKLLEHLFIGEILRHLWRLGITNAEFLRPEVDSGGYDLVIGCNDILRHIQLKSSVRGATTAKQSVSMRLAEKPSGCVVWLIFDEHTLALGPYLWFGGLPGSPLPDIKSFPLAKHTKANSHGVKAARPNVRVIKRAQFAPIASIPQLIERLFGVAVESSSQSVVESNRADRLSGRRNAASA